MKANARSYFWWSLLDREIEQITDRCRVCSLSRPEPKKAVLMPGVKSDYVYEKGHADFLGPIKGKMILIITEAFSKCPEVFIMKSTNALSTVEKFTECFARFGLPTLVVTDNGPQFC